MNNNKFLSFLLAVPFFAAAEESKKDDKKDNKNHSKLNYGIGGGAFLGYPINESFSGGVVILGRYSSSCGVNGLVGAYGNMSISNDYVQGMRIVAGAILGAKGKSFESTEYKLNEMSVAAFKAEGSFFKGVFGMVLADFGYVMGGIYGEWSSKGVALDKSVSVGVVIMPKYSLNDYIEGSIMLSAAYNLASKESKDYTDHRSKVSDLITEATKDNVAALDAENAKGELANKDEIKRLTESIKNTKIEINGKTYTVEAIEMIIAHSKNVGTTEAETKELEATLEALKNLEKK